MKAPAPPDEAARLEALRQCHVLDTDAESVFDDIARLAAHICRTPVALVSLVDAGRQWFKARVGLEAAEAPREAAFCAHAILHPDLFVVADAAADERFATNPLVTAAPHVRFYAGAPLVTSEGHALGTLCVIDRVPRRLTPQQAEALRVLARQAASQLELRRSARRLAKVNAELDREMAERLRAEREREELLVREQRTRAEAEANERHYHFLADSIPQQVWTASADGALDYVNQTAHAYFGLPPAALLGDDWQAVLHEDDLAPCLARWRHSLSTGETYEVEFRLRRADGQYRWHLGRAVPMRDEAGRVVKWYGTNTDIDEQKRLHRLAQEANRAKDEFLATVSHELRTPLTSMMGWAELLKLGVLDEAKQRHALDVIEASARAQAQLIGDLLDLSRISSGRLRLDVRPVELAQIIKAAVDVIHPAAEAKSLRLVTELSEKVGPLAGDPDRLQQVVWNLLSNAVKFTPEGGRVRVRLRRAGGHAEIVVSDSGVGIAPAFLPYVFDRFRQADSTDTRAHGGLGLGLAIVRHLVELHGGTVSAESAGEGKGATFRVRLPLAGARRTERPSQAEAGGGRRTPLVQA